MSDHINQTIADLQVKLQEQERVVTSTKLAINTLCEIASKPPIYPNAGEETAGVSLSIASDEFYGKPLAAAMRTILEKRKLGGNGPASPRELYDALLEGGYLFDTEVEQNRLTGVRVSLRKSSKIFHRLPDKKRYGLLEWYPAAKRQASKEGAGNDSDDAESESEAEKKAIPDQE